MRLSSTSSVSSSASSSGTLDTIVRARSLQLPGPRLASLHSFTQSQILISISFLRSDGSAGLCCVMCDTNTNVFSRCKQMFLKRISFTYQISTFNLVIHDHDTTSIRSFFIAFYCYCMLNLLIISILSRYFGQCRDSC